MALSTSKVPVNIRAAAVLTTGAVASNTINVPATLPQRLGLLVTFTLGSLTNVQLTPQVSPDGTNWYNVQSAAGAVGTGVITLTASGNLHVPLDLAGMKLFRVQAQGTGVVTGSSLQLDVGYQVA